MIKVADIAYARLSAPDLDTQEEFLRHFGMARAARTENALYMRGSDSQHHIHITEKGDVGTVGLGFNAASEDDLARAAEIEGASDVEAIDEPGGGQRVRLTDPNGYRIEIVWGLAELEPLAVRENAVNIGSDHSRRVGKLTRLERGPSHVKRLGHAVFVTANFEATIAWYRENAAWCLETASEDLRAFLEQNYADR